MTDAVVSPDRGCSGQEGEGFGDKTLVVLEDAAMSRIFVDCELRAGNAARKPASYRVDVACRRVLEGGGAHDGHPNSSIFPRTGVVSQRGLLHIATRAYTSMIEVTIERGPSA